MKQLILFMLLTAAVNLQAQTCTRLTYQTVTTVNGEGTSSYTEITTCGDKSVSSSRNGEGSSKYVINPSEKRQLILIDAGGSYKVGTVLPIIDPDSFPDGPFPAIKDTDYHFTGKMKTIAGYECEEFTLELPVGGKATGYLAHGIKVGTVSSLSGIMQTDLGLIMQYVLLADMDMGITTSFTVTKLETGLTIEDAYFSTGIPAGYSDLMEGMNMPHE